MPDAFSSPDDHHGACPPEAGVDLKELGLLLKTAQHLAHQAIDAELAPLQLNLGHWAVLREIDRSPGATGSALAEATFQTRQSLSEAVTKLEQRGLVERKKTSRQRLAHHLTGQGVQALAHCDKAVRAATDTGFINVTQEDQRRLAATLSAVINSFSAGGRRP